MSDGLVIVSLLTVIAVRKIWLELFEDIISFITFRIFFRSLMFSWKNLINFDRNWFLIDIDLVNQELSRAYL